MLNTLTMQELSSFVRQNCSMVLLCAISVACIEQCQSLRAVVFIPNILISMATVYVYTIMYYCVKPCLMYFGSSCPNKLMQVCIYLLPVGHLCTCPTPVFLEVTHKVKH